MNIGHIVTNLFGENIYFLWDESTKECIVVDPGMMKNAERLVFDKIIDNQKFNLKAVILTHMHIDHAYSAQYVANKYNVPIYASKGDEQLGLNLPQQAESFNLNGEPIEDLTDYFDIDFAPQTKLGDETLEFSHIAGHSEGSILIYAPKSGFALTGDAIFAGSIGRTDLPGGDFETLRKSIIEIMYSLPEDTLLFPGHGEKTTVIEEKKYNPYVNCM